MTPILDWLKFIVPSAVALASLLWAVRGGVIGNLRAKIAEMKLDLADMSKELETLRGTLNKAQEEASQLRRDNYKLMAEVIEVERLLPPDMRLGRKRPDV